MKHKDKECHGKSDDWSAAEQQLTFCSENVMKHVLQSFPCLHVFCAIGARFQGYENLSFQQ